MTLRYLQLFAHFHSLSALINLTIFSSTLFCEDTSENVIKTVILKVLTLF